MSPPHPPRSGGLDQRQLPTFSHDEYQSVHWLGTRCLESFRSFFPPSLLSAPRVLWAAVCHWQQQQQKKWNKHSLLFSASFFCTTSLFLKFSCSLHFCFLFLFFPPLMSLFTQFRDSEDFGRFPAAYAQV